jgi:hypothetical protein
MEQERKEEKRMSWIIDALKEPFQSKKGKKAETKEDKLKQIEELKQMLKEEEDKIIKEEKIKVIKVDKKEDPEIPLPPKFEEKVEEGRSENVEVTTEQRLKILEDNLNVIITDLHNRLNNIESFLFRNK